MQGTDIENETMRRVNRNIVYFFFLLFLFSSLDRTNVSFASLQMNHDLGFDPEIYGFGAGLFFFPYLMFQLPNALLLRKVGVKLWVASQLILWGIAGSGMALVEDKWSFYGLRLLIGFAEAGFAPGATWFFSQWVPKRSRAKALSILTLGIPLSFVVGGPLSAWFLSLDHVGGLAGWQWLFIGEGVPPFFLSIIAYRMLCDTPAEARWLSSEQRAWLIGQLSREREEDEKSGSIKQFRVLMGSIPFWTAAVMWLSITMGIYGMVFWLPQVIKLASGFGNVESSLLSTIPWIAAGTGMVLNARHSDRTQERIFHVAGGAVVGALGLVLSASTANIWVTMAGLTIGGLGMGAAQGVFWSVPMSFLTSAVAAAGIALINLLGNTAGVIGPNLIGWLRQTTGSFNGAIFFLSAVLLIGCITLILGRKRTA